MKKLFSFLSMYISSLFIFSFTPSVEASTAVMLTDEDLIVSSRAIVRGTVVGSACRFDENGGNIYTYLTVRVDEVLKGAIFSRSIVVRQPGGRVGDMEQIVIGAPVFAANEEVLLYLNTASDGALRIAHLFMGKFSIVRDESTGMRFASRSTKDNNLIGEQRSGKDPITDFMELDSYIGKIRSTLIARADRAAEFERLNAGRLLLEVPKEYKPSAIQPQFTLLDRFMPSRRHEADEGTPILYKINPALAPIPNGGIAEFEGALAAWTNIETASIILTPDGMTGSCGIDNSDKVNTVSFGDCKNQLDGLVNCSGALAIAIFSRINDARTINRQVFFRIVDADIIVNNGVGGECFGSPSAIAQILTHEVGHTIGLGHSSERRDEPNPLLRDATMYFSINNDGRGAAVRGDDIAGATFIYPSQIAEPLIASFAPTSGPVGTSVVITGRNLGGVTTVMFNGVEAEFAVDNPGQITTRVPMGATTGLIVAISRTGRTASVMPFTVTEPGTDPTPDFAIVFRMSELTVERRKNGLLTVGIERVGGFDGNVAVTPDLAKAKLLKITFTQPSLSTTGASVTFDIKAKKRAPLGPQQITFTGKDDQGRVRVGTLTLLIQ